MHELEQVAAPYGTSPYLVYTGASGSPRINHVVVDIETDGDRAVAHCRGFGRGVPARAVAGATLTLLWPAHEAGGFSLIADGTGRVTDDVLTISVSDAVLHRPAPVDGSTSC